MECQVADLFEYPHDIPLVAHWIHGEFWSDKDIHTPDSLAELLRMAKRPDEVPLSLLGLASNKPVGTVNLIENDDDSRPDLRPWLAALFVVPEYRGRGIGSTLVRTLQQRATSMDIDAMYLGTDVPEFYKRFGAIIHEQLDRKFCIMKLTRAIPGIS